MTDDEKEQIVQERIEQARHADADERQAFHEWQCMECAGHPRFDHPDFVLHAKEIHGLEDGVTGRKRMVAHMDARTWFQTNYEWTVNGMAFIQSIRLPRHKSDMMRYV